MSNRLYTAGIVAQTGSSLSWVQSAVRVVAVTGITFDDDAQSNLSDIPVGNRVATSALVAGKTNVAAVHDAINAAIAGVAEPFDALIGYIDTNTASTSPLLFWLDTVLDDGDNPVPISVNPDNADVSVVWHPSGIFQWAPT